jgi:hypothetical protein
MEFTHWKAFHRINPIGEVREDYRSAMIAYMIAAAHAGKNNKLKMQDFLLFERNRRKRRRSPEELQAYLMAFMGVHNGRNQHTGSKPQS